MRDIFYYVLRLVVLAWAIVVPVLIAIPSYQHGLTNLFLGCLITVLVLLWEVVEAIGDLYAEARYWMAVRSLRRGDEHESAGV